MNEIPKIPLNHTVGGVAPRTPPTYRLPHNNTLEQFRSIPLHYTLVPLHFAPTFRPFFSIYLFAQIWATYYNKVVKVIISLILIFIKKYFYEESITI